MSARADRGECRYEVAATSKSVPAMREALDRILQSHHIAQQRATDIKLALTEACTNVVQHAYLAGAPGDMVVVIQCNHDALIVSVEDRGRGVDAESHRPGLGLGLPVIEATADAVAITDLQPGTSVRMTFSR